MPTTDDRVLAVNELRDALLSEGYSRGLIADVAKEHGISQEALVNRFTVAFRKHPSEYKPCETQIVHGAHREAHAEALAWAQRTNSNSPYVGRKFVIDDQEYVFSHSRNQSVRAVAVTDGDHWTFYQSTWNEIVKQVDPLFRSGYYR
jgi:predicted ATP-grasp superfamily ATP-dependent carboligase